MFGLEKIANLNDLLNAIYPVGSIYISTNNNSPQNFLGGTWVRIEGRFLLGASSRYAAGSTGGEAEHLLSTSEMPMHIHAVKRYLQGSSSGASFTAIATEKVTTSHRGSTTSAPNLTTETTGSSLPHNNMPPYLAVYIWKRTA